MSCNYFFNSPLASASIWQTDSSLWLPLHPKSNHENKDFTEDQAITESKQLKITNSIFLQPCCHPTLHFYLSKPCLLLSFQFFFCHPLCFPSFFLPPAPRSQNPTFLSFSHIKGASFPFCLDSFRYLRLEDSPVPTCNKISPRAKTDLGHWHCGVVEKTDFWAKWSWIQVVNLSLFKCGLGLVSSPLSLAFSPIKWG